MRICLLQENSKRCIGRGIWSEHSYKKNKNQNLYLTNIHSQCCKPRTLITLSEAVIETHWNSERERSACEGEGFGRQKECQCVSWEVDNMKN